MSTIMPQIAFCTLAYLLSAARGVQAQNVVSRHSPRSYAPWRPEEVELLRALINHGVSEARIAELLQRTVSSISYELGRNRLPEQSPHYPLTSVKLCTADLELLNQVPEIARYLEWDFAAPLPASYSAPAKQPTLRIIEVEPDPLYRDWRLQRVPDPVKGHWAAYHNDADMAVQGVWADLAATLTRSHQQVLLRPPDRHNKRRTAVRVMLKRASALLPRNSVVLSGSKYVQAPVVLLDDAQAWSPKMICELKAPTVIAVMPSLGSSSSEDALPVGRVSLLPSLVRYEEDEENTELQKRAEEIGHRQDWLRKAGAGRMIERYSHQGLSNAAWEYVPVDWVALKHMPQRGTLYVPDLLGLTQACVWYALLTGLRPVVTDDAWVPRSPVTTADDWHAVIGQTISTPAERLRQRMLLDLECLPEEPCGLSFALGRR